MYPSVHSCTVYNSQNMEATLVSIGRRMDKKLCYMYTMEYYSAIKKNAFESVLTKWMRMHCLLTAFPQLPQGSPQPELSEHSSPACLMLQFQAGTRVSMTEERLQH